MIIAVIPCYNVETFCERVLKEVLPLVDYVVAVDDGSTDRTGVLLREWANKNAHKMTVILFPRNQGKGFAILSGFNYAMTHFDVRVLVTLDGDGQHTASAIPALAHAIGEGADLAIGSRSLDQMPPRSHFGNSCISYCIHLAYRNAPSDTQSGFRAFSKRLAALLCKTMRGGRYETEMEMLLFVLRNKMRIQEIPIPTIYIEKNRSSHFRAFLDSLKVLRTFFFHIIRHKIKSERNPG